jgi:hypothetical protein
MHNFEQLQTTVNDYYWRIENSKEKTTTNVSVRINLNQDIMANINGGRGGVPEIRVITKQINV